MSATLAELRDDSRIQVAEPVYRTSMAQLRVDPNDPRFASAEQWYVENSDEPEAWVFEPGDPATVPQPVEPQAGKQTEQQDARDDHHGADEH